MMQEAYGHHTRKGPVDRRDAAECALALADGCIAAGDIAVAISLLRQAKDMLLKQRIDGKAA